MLFLDYHQLVRPNGFREYFERMSPYILMFTFEPLTSLHIPPLIVSHQALIFWSQFNQTWIQIPLEASAFFKYTGKMVFAKIFKDFPQQIPSYVKTSAPTLPILAPFYPWGPRFEQTWNNTIWACISTWISTFFPNWFLRRKFSPKYSNVKISLPLVLIVALSLPRYRELNTFE